MVNAQRHGRIRHWRLIQPGRATYLAATAAVRRPRRGAGQNDGMSGSRAQRRGLIGRAAEFERLESALRAATAGGGGTVLVAGEAGIGKTRLVAELTEHARRAGAAVLSGRCIDLV